MSGALRGRSDVRIRRLLGLAADSERVLRVAPAATIANRPECLSEQIAGGAVGSLPPLALTRLTPPALKVVGKAAENAMGQYPFEGDAGG